MSWVRSAEHVARSKYTLVVSPRRALPERAKNTLALRATGS
jgi:hypothetical protein